MLGGKAAETKGGRGGQRVEFPVDHCQASRSQYKYLNASPALLLALLYGWPVVTCLSNPFVFPLALVEKRVVKEAPFGFFTRGMYYARCCSQAKKKKREGFVVDEKLIVESVYNGG